MNATKVKISANTIRFVFISMIFSFLIIFSGCLKNRMPSEPIPVDRPQVNNSKPSNAQLIVPTTSQIEMYFTQRMDLSTMQDRFVVQDLTGNPVTGTFSENDTTVIFTPSQVLNKSSVYKILLKGRVRDIYDNSIQYDNRAILDDTTVILSNWFYTEGMYSDNGFNHIFVRDKSKNSIYVLTYLDSMVYKISSFSVPLDMLVISNGTFLLVSNSGKNELDFVNIQTNQVEKSISMPQNPSSIISDGNYAYVVSDYGKAISKIDILNSSIAQTFKLNFYPGKIAVSADGNILFTFDQVTLDLVSISASDGTILNRLNKAVTQLISGNILFDQGSQRLFICDTKGNKLSYTDMNLSPLNTAFTFPAGISPNDLTFDEKYIYAAAGNSVYKLDKQNFTVQNKADISYTVKSLTILPSGDILYAVSTNSIVIIDLNSFFILKEIDLGSAGLEGITSSPNKY